MSLQEESRSINLPPRQSRPDGHAQIHSPAVDLSYYCQPGATRLAEQQAGASH
ncbi:hypothetical protein [Mycoplana ramosa]|uniref:Uncharacterized protein n=1 Tax=Mycoplana ramosa TaxID=40837 RepID=A0ABW3YP62_MYCRA